MLSQVQKDSFLKINFKCTEYFKDVLKVFYHINVLKARTIFKNYKTLLHYVIFLYSRPDTHHSIYISKTWWIKSKTYYKCSFYKIGDRAKYNRAKFTKFEVLTMRWFFSQWTIATFNDKNWKLGNHKFNNLQYFPYKYNMDQ